MLLLSFVFITSACLVAAFVSAGFRESGAAIVGMIVGGYVSIITGASVGSALSKGVRKEGPPEPPPAKSENEEKGE